MGIRLRFGRRPRYRGIAPLIAAGSKMSRREYEKWRDENTWDPQRDANLVIQDDLAPAAWLEPLLIPDSFEVRMTVPQGFDAYARVFFPFIGEDIISDGEVEEQEQITWAQMARRNGRVAHAVMEAETITSEPETCYGDLTGNQLDALLPILTRHTSSTQASFLLWDGFGDLNERAFMRRPKVRHCYRNYYLLRGSLAAYGDCPDAPSYWWPDDRAWCWSTDIDFDWGYLGGLAACVNEVLAEPVLDAQPTRPDNPARAGMDTINDPTGRVPRSL